ncbi:uncharacterized protein LOC129574841 isoform X2 [Sitodiplosis mosellana]|uniref:uncharacterized protein LOC129574841 isoform X2 n=1 Tax=Sitodiplosis mosellana TaxID=263140 RepID=UPI002443A1B6|nr:uncharacterized protein LOC129574841 isoform X2 [Sitodiplosis mosellana]
MIKNIQITRPDINVPFGFSIKGGIDSEQPYLITAVKVSGIAEGVGLRVGDVITHVNGIDVDQLSHENIFSSFTTLLNMMIRIYRDGDIDIVEDELNMKKACDVRQFPDAINSKPNDFDLIDDSKIAEIISAEAELLEDNVIGVNFQKIMPMSNIFKSSEVLKHLNEEVKFANIRKKYEGERESTFLQKPNRPVPKGKNEQQEHQELNSTIGHIEETKKFIISEIETINIHEESNKFMEELHDRVDLASIEFDANNDNDNDEDEMPDLLQCEQNISVANTCDLNECKIEKCTIEKCQIEQCTTEECTVEEECKIKHIEELTESIENDSNVASKPPICDTRDVEMEKQLEIVRKQLEELAQLPSTIQATIEAVKKQIAGLIHLKNMEIHSNTNAVTSTTVQLSERIVNQESKTEIENDLKIENVENSLEENEQASKNDQKPKDEIEGDSKIENGQDSKKDTETDINGATIEYSEAISVQQESLECQTIASCQSDSTDVIAAKTDEQIAKLKLEQCFSEQRERWFNERKQKLQQQLSEKLVDANTLPTKSRDGPKTPSERPLVLPGGRKWRNERDAYNEEFIAETMSAHAELINGSTLGVNFLKYKKPERDLSNLNKSEVFKMIHDSETKPASRISERPPKVFSADDFKN